MEIQETPTPTPRKSVWPFILGIGVVLLLAAAAFMSVRYFVQPKTTGMEGPGGNFISVEGPGGEAQSFRLDITPAEELPQTQPDEAGIFVERKDNSVFIGTGEVTVMAKAEPGQEPQVDTDFSGPKVEVVISGDTVVYKDTTQLDPENPGAQVQQTVELSTIDEITQQSSVTVWGRKAGDRIIAEVVVFSSPFMIKAPGAGAP
jgi:hypothetical protein